MKVKTNIILNSITLVVTSFLLVIIVLAWYVSNKEVRATGLIAGTEVDKSLVASVNIYEFSERKENDVFVIDKTIPEQGQKIVMGYNPNGALDESYKPSMKLIEINFIENGVNLNELSPYTRTSKFVGYNNQENPGWVTTADLESGLSFSSVVKFKLFDTVAFNQDNSEITFSGFDLYSWSSFDDANQDGIIDNTRFNLLDSLRSNIKKIYVLIEFNAELMERIFTNNLGNQDMDAVLYDDTKQLNFTLDFKFLISGEEVK